MINACQKCLPTSARHLHQRDPLLPALCCSIFQTYKSEHSNRSAGLPRRDVSSKQTVIVWQACTASSVWCKTSPPARAHLNGCSRKPSGNHGTDLETGSIDTRALHRWLPQQRVLPTLGQKLEIANMSLCNRCANGAVLLMFRPACATIDARYSAQHC